MILTDLPHDILVLIFPYLDACDFLSLTSSSSQLLPFRSYNPYWSCLTRATFRLPPQPVLQPKWDDGHWQRLYRTIHTQSTVFTWGNDANGNLGHWGRQRAMSRGIRNRRRSIGWPGRMKDLDDVGIVSDVQCGGWSTVLLNSSGQLWATGVLNGEGFQGAELALTPLRFPGAFPITDNESFDPSTAITQYSVGRHHVVALADDGKIWEWVDFAQTAKMIKFANLSVAEGKREGNRVQKVVAGWSACSAFVAGEGIVTWDVDPSYSDNEEVDALLVDHALVPGTGFGSIDIASAEDGSSKIRKVRAYVFLESYIVFTTEDNRVYIWSAFPSPISGSYPKELVSFHRSGSKILDLQGSHQRFGVFTDTGDVLIGHQSSLDSVWDSPTLDAECNPIIMPALQHASVISLAFGDWHFHALHSDGTITSYGHEPQGCGALGLGSRNISTLRGMHFPNRPGGDGYLQFPSWSNGRRTIWFEEEKERWLSDTCQQGATSEARPRVNQVVTNAEAAGLMGEYFELKGQNWAHGPQRVPGFEGKGKVDCEAIGAYRALKIAAAGWSSAALVLVDGEKAEAIRKKYIKATQITEAEELSTTLPQPGEEEEQQQQQQNPPGLLQSFASLGRSWLAFGEGASSETNDAARSATPNMPRRQAALDSRWNNQAAVSDVEEEIYCWDGQPYPRLQYPDGRTLPGEVPITPWPGNFESSEGVAEG